MKTRAKWGTIKSFVARLLPGQSIKLATRSQCDNIHHRAASLGRKVSTRKVSDREFIVTILD